MENVKTIECLSRNSGRGNRTHKYPNNMGGTTYEREGCEVIYKSRQICLETLAKKMAIFVSPLHQEYDSSDLYTNRFNSWLMSTGFMYESYETGSYARTGLREAFVRVRRTLQWTTDEGLLEIVVTAESAIKKEANNLVCWKVFDVINTKMKKKPMMKSLMSKPKEYIQTYPLMMKVQMEQPEKLGEQGDATQSSDKKVNTIITRDQQQTESKHFRALDEATSITSSEQTHKFGSITSRWMPLTKAEVSINDTYDKNINSIYLPEALYTASECAPNITPFESFIYARMAIEIKVVVNANKFHCGKMVVSSKYDSYQADNVQSGVQSALHRNHIILDLSANNEGILQVPFRYHRPLLRLVKNDTASVGIRPSKYCTINFHILSPLKTGPEGPSTISYRVFYRLIESEFTGMSYRAKVQMNSITEPIVEVSRGIRKVLKTVEDTFDQVGSTNNQDKPGQVNGTIVIPKPRWNFGTGKGIIDVQPLRVNPHTLTNYGKINVPTDEPKSFYDVARIWGPYKRFPWSKDDLENSIIADVIIDPTSKNYDRGYEGELTPIEYALSNYMFYSGTIELRLDFVSNSFHTGAVQMSVEYGRTTSSTDVCGSASTYTKVFHLGEQKSVTITVPYIYDTVMRRTTESIYFPYGTEEASEDKSKSALTVAPLSLTRFKVRVLNALRPVAAASQEIEVILFIRGGKNFKMHGLKSSSYMPVWVRMIDDFPYQYAPTTPAYVGRAKRETDEERQARQKKLEAKQLPKDLANEWNEYRSDKLQIARTQMDNGEKEDVDPTQNFRDGTSSVPVTTLDDQTNFKDLLRRPTLLMRQQVVKRISEESDGFFIPCVPPNKDLCTSYEINASDNGPFSCVLKATSAVAIMNMMRCYRGGMRYTIVIFGATKPVYVTQIPHSGVRCLGNRRINGKPYMPIYGANFNTEIIVPTVNPTAVIEVPYDTENTWSLTFCEDATRNFSWRDFGDYNMGHLVISSYEDIVVDVWWSAADDFEVSNFYGVPNLKTTGYNYRYSDKHARVQMDFQDSESSTSVERFLTFGKKMLPSVKTTSKLLLGSIPVVGQGLAMAAVGSDLNDSVEKVTERVLKTTSKLDNLADQTQISLAEITKLIKDAVSSVSGTLTTVFNGTAMLTDFLIDLLLSWYEKSWTIVGVSIIKFILKIFIKEGMEIDLYYYAGQLTEYLRSMMANVVYTTQAPPSTQSTLVGILVGLVGTIFGVTLDPHRRRTFPMAIFERITQAQGVQYLLAVLRFVQGIFDTIKVLALEALGYVSAETKALKMLAENDTKIQAFVREAQIMTSEVNGSMILTPQYRLRFWRCVLEAYQYQRILCSIPANQVHSLFSKLCYDVIKVAQEKFLDISSSPVRYEPFVIAIEGEPGIGKSYMTESFVRDLLGAIGYENPSVSSIFYRSSGDRFWSGYRDQPVVVYDEFLNLRSSEKCVEQITELFKLKSTSLFIPEMAHLEEKKIRANPLIILIITNNAFPDITDHVTHSTAVFRRRDLVLRANLSEAYRGKNLRENANLSHDHLLFQKYRDSGNRESLILEKKSYTDMKNYVVQEIKKYHKQEIKNVRLRTEQVLYRLRQGDENELTLQDPFTLFYNLNGHVMQEPAASQNAWTPYEQLEVMVDELSNQLRTGEEVIRQNIEDSNDQAEGEEIDWDLPQTQGLITYMLGFTLESGLFRKLLTWGKDKLLSVEEDIWSGIKPIHECCVCKETVAISYVCRQSLDHENPHYMCLPCYRGIQMHSNGLCPMCRSRDISLAFTRRTWSALTVGQRLVSMGVKPLIWFIDKCKALVDWRRDNALVATLVDFLLDAVIYQRKLIQELSSGFLAYIEKRPYTMDLDYDHSCVLGVWAGRWCHLSFGDMSEFMMDQWAAWTQGDSWDDPVPSTSGYRDAIETDTIIPVIDDNYLESLMFVEFDEVVGEGMPCVHTILQRGINRVRLEKETWRVQDPSSGRVLDVPVGRCASADCIITQPIYRQLIEHYLRNNINDFKRMYVDYITRPSDMRLALIPPLYRAPWMVRPTTIISKNWWEWLSEIYDKYKHFIYYLGGVVVAIGTVIKLYNLINTVSNGVQGGGMCGSPEDSPRHASAKFSKRIGPRYFQGARDEDQAPSVFESTMRDIEKNTFKFEIVRSTTSTLTMYGVGLFGHYVLMPRHYVKEMEKAMRNSQPIFGSKILQPQTRHRINLLMSDFVMSEEADIAYCKLPTSFELFKDIRKKIATEDDLNKYLPSSATLLVVPSRKTNYMRQVQVDLEPVVDTIQVMDTDNKIFTAREVLKYNYSMQGACGSLVLIENNQRPIIGMHFAGYGEDGHKGDGMAVILTQEAFGTLAHTQGPTTEDKLFLPYEEAKMIFPADVQITEVGSLSVEETPFIPSKSKLVKSEIFGMEGLETDMEPAILNKQDPRWIHKDTPLLAGCKAHGKLTEDFTTEELEEVGDQLWSGVYSGMLPIVLEPKELTIEESIVGLPHMEYYKGIDLSTSAGYPYVLTDKKTKKDYVDVIRNDQDQVIGVKAIDKVLRNEIERKDKLRKQGIIPHTLFVDTLKDEKKTREKARKYGGTRVFCNSPFDYVIACRQKFLHFIAAFMKNRHKLMHAVGINVMSDEWTILTNKLLAKNNKFITIDYTNFGPGYNAGVAEQAYNILIKWTLLHVKGVNELELKCMVMECLQSEHIMHNTVYRQTSGSPSGAVFTTIVNTLVNQLYLLLAWNKLVGKWCKDNNYPIFKAFKEFVTLYTYGDDAILSVDPRVTDLYNGKTITSYFSGYGIVATDSNKTGEIKEFESFQEATFLKRGFLPHPKRQGKFLSPLKEKSLIAATQWVWKSSNNKMATKINAEAAVLQAHGHGREKFNQFRDLVNKHLAKKKIKTVSYTWEEIDDKFFGTGLQDTFDDYITFGIYN